MKRIGVIIILIVLLVNGCERSREDQNRLNTALIDAVSDDDLQKTEKLIADGAEVNALDAIGRRPIVMAGGSQSEIIKLLLDKGADINAENAYGDTALHYAVIKKSNNIPFLLDAGCSVNAVDSYNETPLMLASKTGMQESVAILLLAAADTSVKNNDGNTALLLALQQNNLNSAKLLIKNKADINVKNKKNITPLYLVLKNIGVYLAGDKEIIISIEKHINRKNNFSKILRAEIGILKHGNYKKYDLEPVLPFPEDYVERLRENRELLIELLENDVSVDIENEYGNQLNIILKELKHEDRL